MVRKWFTNLMTIILVDYFEIMVRDDNFSGYSFQKVIIPVSLDILPVNDSPVFETKPPFYDEGLQKVILSDEKTFYMK